MLFRAEICHELMSHEEFAVEETILVEKFLNVGHYQSYTQHSYMLLSIFFYYCLAKTSLSLKAFSCISAAHEHLSKTYEKKQ